MRRRDRVTLRQALAAVPLVLFVTIPAGLLGAIILGITQLTE